MAESMDIVRAFLTEVGRKGGLSRSPRKARAARRNLAKGRKVWVVLRRASK